MWNYRVIRKKIGGQYSFGIHEVFYDDKRRAWSCTQDPVAAGGDSKKDVLVSLRMMLLDAIISPTMDFNKIPERGAKGPKGLAPKKKKKRRST